MQKTMLGKIRIAPGQVGYYDEYSGIYLNLTNPEAVIYSGMNLYQIKKSVKSGRLKLVEGTLTEKTESEKVLSESNTSIVVKTKKENNVIEAANPILEEQQMPATGAVIEKTADEPITEKPKRSRRKRKTEEITEPVEQVAEESALEEAIE